MAPRVCSRCRHGGDETSEKAEKVKPIGEAVEAHHEFVEEKEKNLEPNDILNAPAANPTDELRSEPTEPRPSLPLITVPFD
jgi:hypothetical protein